jgi:hypothetical protein
VGCSSGREGKRCGMKKERRGLDKDKQNREKGKGKRRAFYVGMPSQERIDLFSM